MSDSGDAGVGRLPLAEFAEGELTPSIAFPCAIFCRMGSPRLCSHVCMSKCLSKGARLAQHTDRGLRLCKVDPVNVHSGQ